MVDPPIVLASASPRRADLLRRLGLVPVIRPADVDEHPLDGESADELVRRLAADKALAVERDEHEVVIAADTVVVLDGRILGKPTDDGDAARMLAALSARDHRVVTGVHVVGPGGEAASVESTVVTLRAVTPAEIDAYVATGEPRDKAGAYAVQGRASMFVSRLSGSDTNVIGLPLEPLVRLLAEIGVTVLPR